MDNEVIYLVCQYHTTKTDLVCIMSYNDMVKNHQHMSLCPNTHFYLHSHSTHQLQDALAIPLLGSLELLCANSHNLQETVKNMMWSTFLLLLLTTVDAFIWFIMTRTKSAISLTSQLFSIIKFVYCGCFSISIDVSYCCVRVTKCHNEFSHLYNNVII